MRKAKIKLNLKIQEIIMNPKISTLIILFTAMFLYAQQDYICWNKTYGNEVDDGATSVIELSNGNYAVAGYYGFMMSEDWYVPYCQLNLLDPLGNIIWELWYADETRGGTFVDIVESDDGCIIAIKNTLISAVNGWRYGVELFKIDLERNILWNKLYTHGESMSAEDLTKTADGGYAVCGDCDINDSLRVGIVMKFDQNGDSLWTTTVRNDGYSPSFEGYHNYLNSVVSTNNNEIVTVGYNNDRYGSDRWIVKLDENGNVLFNVDIEDTLSGDYYSSIAYNNYDDSYIATGNIIEKVKNDTDITITKFNSDCEIQWQKTYGYVPDSWEDPFDICMSDDGGFVITGRTRDIWEYLLIMKCNSEGDSLWTRIYSSNVNCGAYGTSVNQTADSGYIVCGTGSHDFLSTMLDMWVLKLDTEGLVTGINEDENITESFELYQNYPNPFNNQTVISYSLKNSAEIELNVYNIKGEFIINLFKCNQKKGSHSVQFIANDLNSGIYYYQLKVDGCVKATKRMVYLK
jgi:hypothetical protein